MSITVAIVNDQPTAASQLVAVNEDTPTSITLAGNDVETALANLTFTVIVPPAHGGLSATTVPGSAPTVTYTPAANYNGPDSFTFTVTDRGDPDACGIPGPACTAAAASNPATVSITVKPVNDVPVAVKHLLTTNEDTPLVITLPGSDVETAPANLTFSIVTGPKAWHAVRHGAEHRLHAKSELQRCRQLLLPGHRQGRPRRLHRRRASVPTGPEQCLD